MATKEGRRRRFDAAAQKNGISIKIRFWMEKNGKSFLAEGRVSLLKNIKKYGSISQAAKKMKISYAHAWKMIKQINAAAGKKIVSLKSGGASGGGATLTPYGEISETGPHMLPHIKNWMKYKALPHLKL